MKQYIAAPFALDPVKTARSRQDAIDKEHKETMDAAVKSLNRDELGGTVQLLARKWVEKRSPEVFTDLLQASSAAPPPTNFSA